MTKAGGKMADSGSVLFQFQRIGVVMVEPTQSEDAAFEAAMEAGATDFQPSVDDDGVLEGFKVLCAVEDYATVSGSLSEQGLALSAGGSGLVYVPVVKVELDDAAYDANDAMMERILAVDDVDAVYSNFS